MIELALLLRTDENWESALKLYFMPSFAVSGTVLSILAKPEPVSSFTLLAIGSIEFTWVL